MIIGLGDRLGFYKGKKAILNSRNTFKAFMELMEGIDKFILVIKEEY